METDTPTISQRRLLNDAVIYAEGSEFATKLHEGLGYALAAEVVLTTHPSWAEFGTHAVASSLDGADGKLKDMAVRTASKVLFKHERNIRDDKPTADEWIVLKEHDIADNPRGDERTDKRYFYSLMGSLMVRMARNGNNKTAAILTANVTVSKIRDDTKGSLRDYAQSNGWETNAKALGKAKTALHNIGIGVLLAPVFNNRVGRTIGSGLISVGTLVGIADLSRYKRYLRQQEQLSTEQH